MLIENATIVDNESLDGPGGGVWINTSSQSQSADDVTLKTSTLCANMPDQIAGASYIDGGGNDICDCTGDTNSDGVVDGQDLAVVLGNWGCSGVDCIGDLNDDGIVNGADLASVLGYWGLCN